MTSPDTRPDAQPLDLDAIRRRAFWANLNDGARADCDAMLSEIERLRAALSATPASTRQEAQGVHEVGPWVEIRADDGQLLGHYRDERHDFPAPSAPGQEALDEMSRNVGFADGYAAGLVDGEANARADQREAARVICKKQHPEAVNGPCGPCCDLATALAAPSAPGQDAEAVTLIRDVLDNHQQDEHVEAGHVIKGDCALTGIDGYEPHDEPFTLHQARHVEHGLRSAGLLRGEPTPDSLRYCTACVMLAERCAVTPGRCCKDCDHSPAALEANRD